MILRCPLDLVAGFKLLNAGFALDRIFVVFRVFVSLIESDSCFQHQKHVVAGTLDLTNGRQQGRSESDRDSLIAFPSSCINSFKRSSNTLILV